MHDLEFEAFFAQNFVAMLHVLHGVTWCYTVYSNPKPYNPKPYVTNPNPKP